MQTSIIGFIDRSKSSYLLGGFEGLGCFGARAPLLKVFDPLGWLEPERLILPLEASDFNDINLHLLICNGYILS